MRRRFCAAGENIKPSYSERQRPLSLKFFLSQLASPEQDPEIASARIAVPALAVSEAYPRIAAIEFTDNPAENRSKLVENGLLGFEGYEIDARVLVLPHVEAHPDQRGSGAIERLMKGVLNAADAWGLEVKLVCGCAVP